jgi:hypothetical protein
MLMLIVLLLMLCSDGPVAMLLSLEVSSSLKGEQKYQDRTTMLDQKLATHFAMLRLLCVILVVVPIWCWLLIMYIMLAKFFVLVNLLSNIKRNPTVLYQSTTALVYFSSKF